MKSNKDFRGGIGFDAPEDMKRGTKLPPAKKSGKERHALYSEFEEEDEIDSTPAKKESVFDYFDDDGEDDL